jgi:hypothetical protein
LLPTKASVRNFDAQLRQVRNGENPHDYEDLNDFKPAHFAELVE